MDWDFGVYLPAKLWENHKPKVAAKAYFQLVEGLLQNLCEREGWELLEGKECKDTCIRIEVDTWAHIDIPLYAAPEHQFALITERAEFAQRQVLNAAQTALDALDEEPFAWEDLKRALALMEQALAQQGIAVDTATTDDEGPGRRNAKPCGRPLPENGALVAEGVSAYDPATGAWVAAFLTVPLNTILPLLSRVRTSV